MKCRKHRTMDTRYKTLDTGHRTQVTRYRTRKSGVLRLVSCIFLLVALLGLVGVASAQRQGRGLGDEQVRVTERDDAGKASKLSFFNLVNVDITDVLKFMSDETNLTMIASERVKGKVTLVNLKDITVEEALEAIKTALNTLGLTTIRVNRTIVIIPLEDAKTKPVRVQIGSDPEGIESVDEMITQIMPLKSADAAEMAQNLKNLVPKTADMFADVTTNSLVITDASSNIRRIAYIIKQLDTAPTEVLETRIFQLTYANATELEQTLDDMFRQGVEMARGLQRMSSRGTEEMMRRMRDAQQEGRMPGRGIDFVKGLVFIESDERTNKLIITASAENLASIEKMITELDTSAVAQAEIRVFPLSYGIAEDVADELENLLQGGTGSSSRGRDRYRPPWERGRGGGGEGGLRGIEGEVNIVSDERLNAVIVVSDPQNFSLIEKIINELDQQVDPQEVIRIIPLEYADAQTIVDTLNNLFEGADSNADMPWWERDRRRREGRDEGEGITGIQGTVNMVADVRLNSVVVSTASANIPVLEGLIAKLDTTVPDLETSTRIYPLVNADAENLADILSNIYQNNQNSGFNRFFFLPRSSRNTSSRGTTITGTITVSAYPRSNSLIVTSSSARNFELVESLIKQLDQATPEDFKYSTLIYPLEYSDADQISDLLNNIFSEEGSYSSQRQSRDRSFFRMMMGGSTTMLKDMSTLAGQVQVNSDPQTNSLIIVTPSRNFEAVKEIIRQLDIVRGQVWLEITVVEVMLSDDTKLGLEWSWSEENHLGKKDLTGELGTAFQLDEESIGFTYKVFNKNLTALLHTLMRENKVRVLSTTSLPTRDNTTATLSKGKDIPYLESTRTDNYGNIMYDYNFLQDIGITIEITPHIAKTGLTKLETGEKRTVGLDITTMNVSNFVEYTDFNAPITADSNVTTYVDVVDGDQIVIGGMMRTETKQTTHQIPILGSIPFIGRLFKKTEEVKEDTELLILITPHIIDINREEDRATLKGLQDKLNNKETGLVAPGAETQAEAEKTTPAQP